MPDMAPTLFVATVDKLIKNEPNVGLKEKQNLLQNGIFAVILTLTL